MVDSIIDDKKIKELVNKHNNLLYFGRGSLSILYKCYRIIFINDFHWTSIDYNQSYQKSCQ